MCLFLHNSRVEGTLLKQGEARWLSILPNMDGSMAHPNGNSYALLLQSIFSKFLKGRNVLLFLKILYEYILDFSQQIYCAVIGIVVCHWVIWQIWNSNMSLENPYPSNYSTNWLMLLIKFTLNKCNYIKVQGGIRVEPRQGVSMTGGVSLTHP